MLVLAFLGTCNIKCNSARLENAKNAVREIDHHNYLETWESRAARLSCELLGERTGYNLERISYHLNWDVWRVLYHAKTRRVVWASEH